MARDRGAAIARAARGPSFDLAAALRFLRGLKRNNDRTWFHAHKADWDRIRAEWSDVVTYLLHAGSAFDPRLTHVDPKRCGFRLANDIRFRNEKTPYKTHLSAWLSPGGKDGSFPGYYVHLAPGASIAAAGIYVPTKPALLALRSTFADDAAPARALDRLVRARALAAYELETDPLRVTPAGFARTHPRIAQIRGRNLLVRRNVADAEFAAQGVAATFLAHLRATAPFVAWIDERIAPGRVVPTDDDAWP